MNYVRAMLCGLMTCCLNGMQTNGYDIHKYCPGNTTNQNEVRKMTCSRLLHRAVQTGDSVAVNQLINNGADISMKNELGKTPIEIALMRADLASFGYLYAAHENISLIKYHLLAAAKIYLKARIDSYRDWATMNQKQQEHSKIIDTELAGLTKQVASYEAIIELLSR